MVESLSVARIHRNAYADVHMNFVTVNNIGFAETPADFHSERGVEGVQYPSHTHPSNQQRVVGPIGQGKPAFAQT